MQRFNSPSSLESRKVLVLAIVAFALVMIGWLLYTPSGVLGKSDAIGYAVCHRIDLRSFQLGSRPVSLCARCTGMYLGAIFGIAFQGIYAKRRGGRPSIPIIAVLGLLTLMFGVDGLNSFTNLIPGFPSLYITTNVIRIFLGTGFGIVIAAVLYPGFNQSAWIDWDRRPAIPDFRTLGILFSGGAVISLLVLTGNPLILYPLSILSAVGVVIILTMAYTMLTLVFFKAENKTRSAKRLAVPIIIGLTLAMLQIAGADAVRFLLTGTWDGFHF